MCVFITSIKYDTSTQLLCFLTVQNIAQKCIKVFRTLNKYMI